MTDTGDAQATGLTEDQAASAFEAMLAHDEGDSSEPENEETAPEQADAEEADGEAEPDEDGEEDDASEEAEGPPAPKTYKVKAAGQELEVSEEELIRGYQREADYSRDKNAIAEERRALRAEAQQIQQERETYANLLPALQQQLQADPYADVDLDALRNGSTDDRAEYAAIIADRQARREQLQAIEAEQQRLNAEQQRQQRMQFSELMSTESQRLLEARPEWRDPEKAQADRKAVIDAAAARGVTEAELNAIADHRVMLLLLDAADGQRLRKQYEAAKPKAQAKIVAVKTARPGAASQQPSKVSDPARLRDRLRRTGSVNDAAALFEKFIT